MTSLIIYLIQSSFCFTVLHISYHLFFRKLTFHNINRIILLSIIPLSLGIPLLSHIHFETIPEAIIIPHLEEYVSFEHIILEENYEKNTFTLQNSSILLVLTTLYLFGAVFCVLKLLLSIIKLFQLKQKSKTLLHKNYSIILTNASHIFSSFKWIFIPKDQIQTIETPVLEHEKAHIMLYHTFDLILTELYLAIFWFNPFTYVFRKTLQSVHEFQADKYVVGNQVKKSEYLELLIKNLGSTRNSKLHSYFNHSLIKKRIDMITKTNSNPKKIIRYILLTPVLFILLTAFIKPELDTTNVLEQIITEEIIVEIPPSIFPVKNGSKDHITAVYGKKFDHPQRKKNKIHKGIDIRAKIGTPIVATANGTVKVAKKEENWGNLIVISHSDGFETWYAHLDSFDVKENQQVRVGDIIGKSGNTGLSTGPHLHYEVRHHGKNVDPMDYIEK
ncbi:peptidoglycan DD-metalloendopeptidase family protein [uncultured Aquimarina sp.]|uniref:peptidoglycan DD-metalloendopeptidase family protein n=1 Tax=uncultured Aquimarina sp. TaxID=575652 RepID=UPI002608A1FF|nr:peptidoglycan DD-metalloendopeptidase family protein [uncultured Aquimarina sp.]